MSTIDKISSLLDKQNKSQKELTDYLGISKNAFTDWKSGRIKSYTKHLSKIAEFLNVSVDYLLGKEEKPTNDGEPKLNGIADITANEQLFLQKYKALDAYGKKAVDSIMDIEYERCMTKVVPLTYTYKYYNVPASAGTGELLNEDSATTIDLPVKAPKGTDFVLRVHGDSMEPEYYDGDYIFVKSVEEIGKGKIGIFVDDKTYLKKFTEEGLESLNPKYKLIPKNNSIRCQGEVIGVYRLAERAQLAAQSKGTASLKTTLSSSETNKLIDEL